MAAVKVWLADHLFPSLKAKQHVATSDSLELPIDVYRFDFKFYYFFKSHMGHTQAIMATLLLAT